MPCSSAKIHSRSVSAPVPFRHLQTRLCHNLGDSNGGVYSGFHVANIEEVDYCYHHQGSTSHVQYSRTPLAAALLVSSAGGGAAALLSTIIQCLCIIQLGQVMVVVVMVVGEGSFVDSPLSGHLLDRPEQQGSQPR